MTKLSDTQLVILNAACKRDDGRILPLLDRLTGGAAAKVVDSLLGKGLVAEVDAKRGEPVWWQADGGHGVTLAITAAGLAAVGITPDEASQAPTQPIRKRTDHQGDQTPPHGRDGHHDRRAGEETRPHHHVREG